MTAAAFFDVSAVGLLQFSNTVCTFLCTMNRFPNTCKADTTQRPATAPIQTYISISPFLIQES